jgi:hypothetical protein
MHKRRDDRDCQDCLRHHHGGRRKQQGERAQGPGARQGEIQHEADDDGRQSEKRIDQNDNQSSSMKGKNRKDGPDGQADGRGGSRRRQADADR